MRTAEGSRKDIEISLPAGTDYREGDHLGVLPVNPVTLVQRVLRSFKLDGGAHLILSAEGRSGAHLPTGIPVRLDDLLFRSVEPQEPATRAQIREMAAYTVCPPHAKELQELLAEATYQAEVRAKRITMLDLLERYEACELPFERFLELLPPLKPRYYSISSSRRLARIRQASRSVSYEAVLGAVRGIPGRGFQLFGTVGDGRRGSDVHSFSGVGLCAAGGSGNANHHDWSGTGVAPFRGSSRRDKRFGRLGRSWVLRICTSAVGIRSKTIFTARSLSKRERRPGHLAHSLSRIDGVDKCYVQHLMTQDGASLLSLLEAGARMYICGDGSRMAPEVEHTLMLSYRERHGVSAEEAAAWLSGLEASGQYVKDVWAG